MCKGGGETGDPRDLKAEQVEARAKRTVASAQQQVVRNKVQQSPVKSTRLLTNLPLRTASAKRVARFYRKRWTLETAFQHLEAYFQSEINTLGYAKAALCGFCLALVAYNMLAVVMAAWRSGHGAEIIDQELSLYYVASDIAQTSHGMMIAIPEDEWRVFSRMRPAEMVATLSALAQKVCLKAYRKSSRGPKKPRPKREGPTQASHVSTAKLLRERKVKAATP